MTTITDSCSALLPPWAERDPVGQAYYFDEYGVAVTDERGLFELVALEVFVVGLSWLTVLRRRDAMRDAFAGFEVDVVAAYDEADVSDLMANDRMIRNERKIRAVIANARAAVELRADGGLPDAVWSVQPETTPTPRTISRCSPRCRRPSCRSTRTGRWARASAVVRSQEAALADLRFPQAEILDLGSVDN